MDRWIAHGREIWSKHREGIAYLFFGGLTTLVNFIVYYSLANFLLLGTTISTNTGWLVSVLFAFVTNRRWVFESRAKGAVPLLRELSSFVAVRLFSGLVNWGIMVLGVDVLEFWDVLVFVFANIIVIILNYLTSKWFVFRKKDDEKELDGNER